MRVLPPSGINIRNYEFRISFALILPLRYVGTYLLDSDSCKKVIEITYYLLKEVKL